MIGRITRRTTAIALLAVTGYLLTSFAGAPTAEARPTGGAPTTASVAEPQPSQDGRRCFVATGTHHARTLLGNTFFRFSHTAHWCSDGQNVIGVHYRDQRFTDVSSFAVVEEITEDFVSPTPAREVTTVMKARVDDCLTRLGCLWSLYPYVRLTLRADGTWFATTGESEGTPA
jgi:hypothetical protein